MIIKFWALVQFRRVPFLYRFSVLRSDFRFSGVFRHADSEFDIYFLIWGMCEALLPRCCQHLPRLYFSDFFVIFCHSLFIMDELRRLMSRNYGRNFLSGAVNFMNEMWCMFVVTNSWSWNIPSRKLLLYKMSKKVTTELIGKHFFVPQCFHFKKSIFVFTSEIYNLGKCWQHLGKSASQMPHIKK